MSYSLVIPPELVSELYHIRERTGKSIRMQILEAIREAIAESKGQAVHEVYTLNKANRGENYVEYTVRNKAE